MVSDTRQLGLGKAPGLRAMAWAVIVLANHRRLTAREFGRYQRAATSTSRRYHLSPMSSVLDCGQHPAREASKVGRFFLKGLKFTVCLAGHWYAATPLDG